MAQKSRWPVLFFTLIAFAVFGGGCVRQSPPAKLPAWLAKNLQFVKTSVEGTVLIDARPAEVGKKHHGGVGIVLDQRHALVPAHVVKGAASVAVHPRSFYEDIPGVMVGDAVPGRVVAVDEKNDSALFESDSDLGTRIMKIDGLYRPDTNEHVWYFGKSNATRFGNVSASSVTAGPMSDVIQVAVDAADGDSGAPLVTDDGRVVGFLFGTSTDNKRTFFIPIGRALAVAGRH